MTLINKLLYKNFTKIIGNMDTKRLSKQSPPDGVTVLSDIPYIDDGNKYHLLDVYYPEGTDKPLPVIFDVHGGGWVYGTKELNKYYCMYLALKGFTVVNINYSMADAVGVHGQLKEIFAALAFVKENADKYFMDLTKFCATGDSAGGHLTLYTALINGDAELAEKYGVEEHGIDIKVIGLTAPAYDLEPAIKIRHIVPFIKYLMRDVLGKDYKNSPYRNDISLNRILKEQKLPPVYISTSKQDFIRSHSVKLAKDLEKRGTPCKLRYVDKVKEHALPHVFNILYPLYRESVFVNEEMCAFFRSNGGF